MPHARFRLSDPELEISGRASELQALLDHHAQRLDRLHERVATSTGRPAQEVTADFREGRSLDATEAARYRLVDEVAGVNLPIRSIADSRRHSARPHKPSPNGPIGFRPEPKPRNS